MENLENFVRNNREDFDEEPNSQVWEKLAQKLNQDTKPNIKVLPLRRVWQIAAMITMFFASVLAAQWYYFSQKNAEKSENLAQNQTEQGANLAPELAEAERYYRGELMQKKLVLERFDIEEVEVKKDFEKHMAELDTVYAQLKSELYESGGENQHLVRAMIENLQIRIDLFNQQIRLLEQINKLKKGQKNEKAV